LKKKEQANVGFDARKADEKFFDNNDDKNNVGLGVIEDC